MGFTLTISLGLILLYRKKQHSPNLQNDKNAKACTTLQDGETAHPCLWRKMDRSTEHWNYTHAPIAIQKFHQEICKLQNVDPVTSDVLNNFHPEPLSTIMSNIGTDTEWTSNGNLPPRVMVVDSIMYNGEPIVPVRLATLNDVVDRFYIIEGTMSFSGAKKEALFKDLNSDVFEPYKDKIHWIVFNMTKNKMDSKGQNWVREQSARSASRPAMKDDFEKGIISHPFVVINTDADEIPDPKDIENFQPGMKYHGMVTTSAVQLDMNDFYYNLNWIGKGSWNLGHTLPGHKVLDGFTMEGGRTDRMFRWASGWIKGGYHMSYFLDADGIRHKLETSVHIEYNREEFKTDEHIQTCVSTGKDLFNRRGQNRIKWDYKQAPLPLQRFHEEICKKQNIDPSTGKLLSDM